MDIDSKPQLNFDDTKVAFSHKTDWQLRKSFGLFLMFSNQHIVNLGTFATQTALKWHLPVSPFIKYTIFEQFCGGETLTDCEKTIEHLAERGVESILDYGVEAKHSEKEYEYTCRQILKSIDYAGKHEHAKVVSVKITGLARFELLKKLHSANKISFSDKKEFIKVKDRLHQIGNAALNNNVQIYFDAEETWIQKPLDELITGLMAAYNKNKPIIFNTIQLYCKERLGYLMSEHQNAAKLGYYYGAKLVRGAYMEKERERAKKHGYPSPIHPNKTAVDHDYNAAIDYCLKNLDTLAFCCASHNEYSNLYCARRMDEKKIPRNHEHVAFGQLYGMGENLTFNLAKAGYNAQKLIPFGPVKDVMPYLIRRAEENSSVGGQVSRELALIKKELKRRGI
jgi:proline dehydrogenase